MSREIKFEIMFLVSTKEFDKKVAKHYTTLDRMIDGRDTFDYSAVEIIAKRQFTGLKDVNGTEIYEGDIVQSDYYYPSYECLCPVEFVVTGNNAGFGFDDGEQDAYEYGNLTVIGNIHENKDEI